MKRQLSIKLFIMAYVFVSFFMLVSYVNEKTIIASNPIYEKSATWDGTGLTNPVAPVAFTNDYVKFSQLYNGLVTPDNNKKYVIENAMDLYNFSKKSKNEPTIYLGLNYVLGNDIDFNEASTLGNFFIPVGFNAPFSGSFDGQGFEIKNLFFSPIIQESVYINDYNEALVYYAMFSQVGATGTVKNLGLKNVWMYQPITFGQMFYASTLIGKNDGIVSHVYYIDNRLEPGLNVDGDFKVSGLMSVNNNTFVESYVSFKTVLSDASTQTVNHTPVLTLNNGSPLIHVYYDDTVYTKDVLATDESLPLTTQQFQTSTLFDSVWFFNNSYSLTNPLAKRNLTYPTLKGLKKDSTQNLLISNARDLVVMSQLLRESNYFRNQNYALTQDINYDSVSFDSYQAPNAGFYGSLSSKTITGPNTLLYTRVPNVGAVDYYSIINLELHKEVMIDNQVNYGLFGVLYGEIKNINFIDMKLNVTNITIHKDRPEVNVGLLTGYISGGKITNTHVFGGLNIVDGQTGLVNLGGFIGKGFGEIKQSSLNGFIDSGSHVYQTTVNESAVGGLIGHAEGISIIDSHNKATVTGFSYITSSKDTLNYVGGVVGYGHVNQMKQVLNTGNIYTYDQNFLNNSIYAAGIIGMLNSLTGEVSHVTNKGQVNFHYKTVTKSRIAGVMNIESANNFNIYSATNNAIIEISNPTLNDSEVENLVLNSSVDAAGVINSYGTSGNFYGLYNYKGFSLNLSLINQFAGVLLAKNDYVSPGVYNNTGTPNNNSAYIKVFQAYNYGNINVSSSNTIYHNWVKISGVVVGKNMDLESIRNTGAISMSLTQEMPNTFYYNSNNSIDGLSNPQKTFKINGVFEEISQNRNAKNIYNGGRLSFYNSNVNVIGNLFISGLGYKNANTNLYAVKGIDHTSVNFTPVEGSLHNAVNDGEIYVDARIKGQSRMAGIVLINESMITAAANTGDVYNSNAIQSSAGTGANFEFEVETGGITFLMASRYAQIRDSVNYGNIVSYSSTGNGWVNASGIATRNDKNESNVDSGAANNFQYFAKIAFSINYGNVFAYNQRNGDSRNMGQETYNKASGILALGLLSSVNNLNYGDIYGKNLASGIYGFVFIDKFVKYGTVNNNEIFISNSVNYGFVRRITSPNAFSYDGINQGISIDMTHVTDQGFITNANGFGGLIGKIHTGSTNNWNYSAGDFAIAKVTFSYLINFDDKVNVVGNAPAVSAIDATIIAQVSGNMATTKLNDTSKEPFNQIKSYTFNANAPTGNTGLGGTTFSGIFHPSYALRTVPQTSNFETDQYISNFIQFIPKSKVNAALLNRLGFSGIAASAGIYALSSTKGIGNGLFMPDNINLNALNPVTYENGVALSDATWQDQVISRGQTLRYKFFTGMKQLDKAIATTVFDLDIYKADDPSVKLKDPEVDNENGLIIYYAASNSDAAYETVEQTTVVDTYVPISQATANSSIATWVPNTYGSNSSEGTWVGNYFYNSNTGSYEYSNTRLYNTTTSTKNAVFSSNNNNQPADGLPTYSSRVITANGSSYTLYQLKTSGNGHRVTSFSSAQPGYGQYKAVEDSYSVCVRNWPSWLGGGCRTYEDRFFDKYVYAGPNTEATYQKITTSATEYTESSEFVVDYNNTSSYKLAYGASLKFNGQAYSGNENSTILTTYGPYNFTTGDHSGSPGLDSYGEHYGSLRVYSESYTGNTGDPDFMVTYRDYKILIRRTKNQSFSSINQIQVDGVNSNITGSNPTNVTLSRQVNYKAGSNPSISFNYNTVNLKDGYDLLDQIKLKDSNNNLVDQTKYRIEGAVVSSPGGFNNQNGTYSNGTMALRVYLEDTLISGNYKLVTPLSVLNNNQQDYIVNFTKKQSNEKLIKTLTYNGITYVITNNQTLNSEIPYGLFYNSNDPLTEMLNFTNMGQTNDPSYIEGFTISENATLVSVVLSNVTVINQATRQHRYTIIYTVRAEDNTTTTFTHTLTEAIPSPNITNSFKNGNSNLTATINEFDVLRQETANIRVEYDLDKIYITDTNFTISSSYTGPEAANAVKDTDYFIDKINGVGFEVDFTGTAAIGTYAFAVEFNQTKQVGSFNLTWNYNTYQDFIVRKLESDVSLIENITFISDTVYAGLNIIMDYSFMNASDYVNYLDNPGTRPIVTLPSTGINYNENDNYNAYYIIGQVQMSDLSFYAPTFYLPFGSEIRLITNETEADNMDLQSTDLFADFSPGEDENAFNYVHYRVYAEDYDRLDNNFNQNYTDYYVAVQDITNNIYFNLTIKYDQNISNFDFGKVFVTFDLFQNMIKQTSMSLFSHFTSTNTGDNLQFRSSMSGVYRVSIDLPDGYAFDIQFESSSIVVSNDSFTIASDILPRRYSLTITVMEVTPDLPWGQQEIIGYEPSI